MSSGERWRNEGGERRGEERTSLSTFVCALSERYSLNVTMCSAIIQEEVVVEEEKEEEQEEEGERQQQRA